MSSNRFIEIRSILKICLILSFGWIAIIGTMLVYDHKSIFLHPEVDRISVYRDASVKCPTGPNHIWIEDGRTAISNDRSNCLLNSAAQNLNWKQVANLHRSIGLLVLPCLGLLIFGWSICFVFSVLQRQDRNEL